MSEERPDFKTVVDKAAGYAATGINIYVRIIFFIVAIGITYTVIESVFFPKERAPIVRSQDASQ